MKGTVTKKGNKWYIVVDLGRDEMGKRKQKWFSGYRLKKDAEKDLPKILNEIFEGTYVEPSKETFENYALLWLENRRNNLKESTFTTYTHNIKQHILPHDIAKMKMEKIMPMHVEKLLKTLHQQYSAATISRSYKMLNAIFKHAKTRGHIKINPCDLVESPKDGKKKIQIWDERQVTTFLEAAKENKHYPAFLLAITTGMRKGEILGLRWSDVDFDNKEVSVKQVLSADGKRIEHPKTNTSYRTIALPDETVQVLKKLKRVVNEDKLKAGGEYKEHDAVICTSLGNWTNPSNLNRTWWKLIAKANLERIRFHDLRHTHASLLLKQGVHPKIVSERLGHSSVKITLDTYSHVIPGLQKAAAENFGNMLFGNSNSGSNVSNNSSNLM